MQGVTASFGPGGANPLCIGSFRNDPHGKCGGIEYPGRKPGCAFLFKAPGGQIITARLLAADGTSVVWEPITLDGKHLEC